jgi:hypothetical protein
VYAANQASSPSIIGLETSLQWFETEIQKRAALIKSHTVLLRSAEIEFCRIKSQLEGASVNGEGNCVY